VTEPRTSMRGRRGRDRRIDAEVAARTGPGSRSGADPLGGSARHRVPDLSHLTGILAATGSLQALAARLTGQGVVGSALRHVTYAGVPHGAKSYLAAALVGATGQRLLWIARDAEIADRAAEELAAWLGDPNAVITLEPRTSLAWERSELVRDESASRVATLAAWSAPDSPARILVASVQALFQRTLAPAQMPRHCVPASGCRRIECCVPSSSWATSRCPRSAAGAR